MQQGGEYTTQNGLIITLDSKGTTETCHQSRHIDVRLQKAKDSRTNEDINEKKMKINQCRAPPEGKTDNIRTKQTMKRHY